MPRTRIKICGVRTLETARAAIDSGADAVGFVFYKSSLRFIEPEDAWPIINRLPPMVTTVGLFVNASFDDYADTEQMCPTDFGQLHGQETEKTVRACGPRIIKAIRFDAATVRDDLARWAEMEEVDAILVDGSSGGQGVALDWQSLADARDSAGEKPIILAGGLTPANVGEAIRIVRPFAVDVSSGVETPGRPGEKDPALIQAFCAAVRRADD